MNQRSARAILRKINWTTTVKIDRRATIRAEDQINSFWRSSLIRAGKYWSRCWNINSTKTNEMKSAASAPTRTSIPSIIRWIKPSLTPIIWPWALQMWRFEPKVARREWIQGAGLIKWAGHNGSRQSAPWFLQGCIRTTPSAWRKKSTCLTRNWIKTAKKGIWPII